MVRQIWKKVLFIIKEGTGLLRDKIEFVCSGGIQDEIYVCVRYSWLCLLLQKDAGGV